MTEMIYRKPFPGLVAFTIAFLSQWLGHGAWAFIRGVFGEYQEVASLAIGAVGVGLVLALNWTGLAGGVPVDGGYRL